MWRETAISRAHPGRGRASAASLRSCFFLAGLFTLALPLMVNAYTLVMRSGRRVEIPDRFNVNSKSLIYEVADGIRVTVRLTDVNIEGTERANGEAPGGFMRRVAGAHATAAAAVPQAPLRTGVGKTSSRRRVVTNKELESFRLKRLTEEAAYEREHAGRGLPSKEQMRQQTEEQDRRFVELARQIEAARAAEEYERLRNEISALQTQVNLLGMLQQQSQPPTEYPNYTPYPFYYPFAYYYPTYVQTGFGFRFRFGHRMLTRHRFGRPFSQFPHHPAPLVGRGGPWRPRGSSIQVRLGSSPRTTRGFPVSAGRARGTGARR